MYSNNDSFQQLKTLLEGRTVLKVEPPNAAEAIAKITMASGVAFRLHATDLGFWIEMTTKDGTGYPSLDTLLTDYYHHTRDSGSGDPVVLLNGDDLEVIADDGRVFSGYVPNFPEWHQKIAHSTEGRKLLEKSACLGDTWKIMFNEKSDECPPELYWKHPDND